MRVAAITATARIASVGGSISTSGGMRSDGLSKNIPWQVEGADDGLQHTAPNVFAFVHGDGE